MLQLENCFLRKRGDCLSFRLCKRKHTSYSGNLVPVVMIFFVLIILFGTRQAYAGTISAVEFSAPEEDFHNEYGWSLGYQFYTWQAFSIPSLGFYDAGRDGFLENHEVALWDSSGNLLAHAVISNASILDGWFRWEHINPVNLVADQWYVIAGFTELDDYTWNPQDIVFDPRIYFDVARYRFDEGLRFPDQNAWEMYGLFGPNFQLAEVHEPAIEVRAPNALSLLAVTGLTFLLLSRLRRAIRVITCGASLMVFCLHAPLASALEASSQAIQGEDGLDNWSPLVKRYERYQYSKTGAIISYDDVFDDAGNYVVEPGEKLRWEWKRNGLTLSVAQVTYLGGDEHCWSIASGGTRCGTIDSWWSMLPFRCKPVDDNYQLITYRNGQQIANVTFAAVPFRIHTDKTMWQYPSALKPKSHQTPSAVQGGKEGQTGRLAVLVTDDLGCGNTMAGVAVEIDTFVVPGSNEHHHFPGTTPGTGRFLAVPGYPATIVDFLGHAKGVTNGSGRFEIDYQAQDFALDERAVISVTRTAENDDEATQVISDEVSWRIQWAEFSPNPTDIPMAFTGSCKRVHPDKGAVHLRNEVWAALAKGEKAFRKKTGEQLTLNDGSFPWGGAVDTVTSACKNHASHRVGKDIDVNSKTLSGKNMLYTQIDLVWVEHPIHGWIVTGPYMVDFLTEKMMDSDFSKVKE